VAGWCGAGRALSRASSCERIWPTNRRLHIACPPPSVVERCGCTERWLPTVAFLASSAFFHEGWLARGTAGGHPSVEARVLHRFCQIRQATSLPGLATGEAVMHFLGAVLLRQRRAGSERRCEEHVGIRAEHRLRELPVPSLDARLFHLE